MKMDRILKYGIVGSLVAFTAIICTVVALLLTMHEKPEHMEQGQMCFPETHGKFQCGLVVTMLSKHIEEVASEVIDKMEIFGEFRTQDKLRTLNPFLKLIGKEMLDKNRVIDDREDDMTVIMEWQYDKDMFDNDGFRSSQFKYRNGHVEVPVDGHYFVHSSIELKIPFAISSAMSNGNALSIPIKHSIFLLCKLEIVDREVASNVQTSLVLDNDSLYDYNSDVSSLVKMSAGDAVSIKLNNITFLNNSQNNEFVVRLVQKM